ncbi:hypothetical protein E4U21_007738 [Claviceps maximensis]|nr:hypothetical protein E4U21_007738 [Claviceps maximensis]
MAAAVAGVLHSAHILGQRRSGLLLVVDMARIIHSSHTVPGNLTTSTTTDIIMSHKLAQTKTMVRNIIEIHMALVLAREVVRCSPTQEEEVVVEGVEVVVEEAEEKVEEAEGGVKEEEEGEEEQEEEEEGEEEQREEQKE